MSNFRTGFHTSDLKENFLPTNSEEQQVKVCSWGEGTNLAWLGNALPLPRSCKVLGGPGVPITAHEPSWWFFFFCTFSWGPMKSMRCHFSVVGPPRPEHTELRTGDRRMVMAKHYTWLNQETAFVQVESSKSLWEGSDWEKWSGKWNRLAVVCTHCLKWPQRGHTWSGTASRREGLVFLCTLELSSSSFQLTGLNCVKAKKPQVHRKGLKGYQSSSLEI